MAKSSIAIPILGYVLIFNEKAVDYLRLHFDFCQGPACGLSWRLYSFYFGSCFFALGSLLYAWFCPALIKRYPDAVTFFRSDKEYFLNATTLEHLLIRIRDAKGSLPSDPHNLMAKLGFKKGLGAEEFSLVAGPMSEHYYIENRLRAPARIATFIAYFTGGILLAIPPIVTAVQIAAIIVGRL